MEETRPKAVPPGPPSVIANLYDRAYSFDFYQAVRLLHWQLRHAPPGEVPAEAVRYSARLSLDAPAAEIYELTPAARRVPAGAPQPPEMVVNFFGLTGPSGALPVHYTELLLERRFQHRDRTLGRFLDIFNHRLTSLFYQAWSKYHVFVDYERESREGFTRILRDLIGLGTEGLRDRLHRADLGVSDQALVYYGGILAQRPRSASGFEAVCSDYFSVRVKVLPFQGRWMRLSRGEFTELGVANGALGDGAMLGQSVWDAQSKFRVEVGPLDDREFRDFLPNGASFIALARLGNFYAGPDLDFDIRLVVRRDKVPRAHLGGLGSQATHLGWNAWIKSGDFDDDPREAVFAVGKSPRWRPGDPGGAVRGFGGRWRPPEAQSVQSQRDARSRKR